MLFYRELPGHLRPYGEVPLVYFINLVTDEALEVTKAILEDNSLEAGCRFAVSAKEYAQCTVGPRIHELQHHGLGSNHPNLKAGVLQLEVSTPTSSAQLWFRLLVGLTVVATLPGIRSHAA